MLVGHCHMDIVRAGSHQMATQSTNLRYLHDAMMDYAEQLISMFPGDKLRRVFFVNSGLVHLICLQQKNQIGSPFNVLLGRKLMS